jgi:hypothetical protein
VGYATCAQLAAASNSGCHLQIQAGLRRDGQMLPAVHVMEVINASIQGDAPERFI